MRNIVLLCSAGMSTSLLVEKMRQAASEIGYDCEVEAYPMAKASEVVPGADIVLLGPQVRFSLDKVKGMAPDKPVEAIDMTAYGMMDGKKVIAHVQQVLGD